MNPARWVSVIAFLGFTATEFVAGPPPPRQPVKTTTAKKTQSRAKTSVHGKQTGSLHAAASKSGSQSSRSRYSRRSKAHSAPAPSYQLHPDPERYQEIQKALADRGYFKGDLNGVWGDDSVEALKRFQADQKLPDDGKINALTLIGLGLGPRHDGKLVTSPGASATSNIAVPPPLPEALPQSAPEPSAAPETQQPPR